uniref:Major capsid protein N-terminal domain-containing protein n=1 Tax=viral metagenome TaxID=1070528 RepID=A0A6C0JW61_9ZZZZ
MASERSGLLSEGALYETLARGNKDLYFIGSGFTDTVNPFETRYERGPGFVNELRRTVPLNAVDFGRSCEFEFDIAGDVFLETTLIIDLPTWLPPVEAGLNRTSGYSILSKGGTAYGYTRGIAYFLFSNIQIYQDKILLQEFSGDTLWASRLSRGDLNSAYLDNALTGMTDVSGGAVSLSKQATPGRLRLTLPMIGGKHGIPSIGMKQQSFRLKLTLRPLEDIVECSDYSIVRPAPWNVSSFTVRLPNKTTYTVAPLPRERIGKPQIFLETRHVYLDPDSRKGMGDATHEIPYSVFYENNMTFGGLDYSSANEAAAQFPGFVKDLDAQHTASRIFWFFRTRDDLERGRRWATSSYNNPYYQDVTFLIAARDRESLAGPPIWNTLVPFAKENRDPGFTIGEMNWDLGASLATESRVPEGSINFSTAEKPVFFFHIRPPNLDQPFQTGVVEVTVVIEAWALYLIEGGRGYFKFGN